MKNITIKITAFSVLVVWCITFSSCIKKFDPSTYAPEKSFGGFSSSGDIEPDHLVAYWAFNGNLTDSIGDLKGTNEGTTFTKDDLRGQALEVGAGHYLVFNDPGPVIPNLQSFTISFWINAPQNTQYGYGIFSLANSQDFWGSLDIYLDNGSAPDKAVFKVHINNANATSPGQFLAQNLSNFWDKWTHIIVTYDGGGSNKFTIYQNGVSVYSTELKDYGALKFVNATAMVIGTWQFQTDPSLTSNTGAQGWAGSMNGALDEFRIYDKALTAAEANALFKLEGLGR